MTQPPSDPRSSRPIRPGEFAPDKRSESDKSTLFASPNRTAAASRAAVVKSLYARRTLIPILLTLGVLLSAIGGAQWMTDPDYPFAAKNMMWSAILLPAIGLFLLAIAAVNMAYVRKKLRGIKP